MYDRKIKHKHKTYLICRLHANNLHNIFVHCVPVMTLSMSLYLCYSNTFLEFLKREIIPCNVTISSPLPSSSHVKPSSPVMAHHVLLDIKSEHRSTVQHLSTHSIIKSIKACVSHTVSCYPCCSVMIVPPNCNLQHG